jgi:GTPase SAR1 family protein
LIGNKSELEDQREITFDRAVDFAKSNGIHKCFETSAKTGMNVEEVFSCAGKELFHAVVREQQENDKVLQDSATGKTKGGK